MNEAELLAAHGVGTIPAEPNVVLAYQSRRSFAIGNLTFHPCACGAYLGADASNHEEVEALLATHQTTARHVAWAKQSR